jgi:phosphoribosylformimino-5-aminoimidazole carboxamide ribotide isomerase
MIVIPAIDLKDGAVIRLNQGRIKQQTRYSSDPVAVALEWQAQGAQWLHVVDLGGAFSGQPKHRTILQRMVNAIDVPIQFGGGLRSSDAIEAVLKIGVERAILGSAALTNPELVECVVNQYGERIAVAIDSREGRVSISGWQKDLEVSPLALTSRLKAAGITRIVYTDITRDGTLKGSNFEETKRMAKETGLAVIASGGVSTLDNIRSMRPLQAVGVEGLIVGKALYEKRFTLTEAIQEARR